MKRRTGLQSIDLAGSGGKPKVGMPAFRARYSLLVAGLLFANAVVPVAHANLIQNGSFESPVNGTQVGVIPSSWQSLGNGSTVDIIHNGFYGAFASDGVQFVDLISNSTFPSGLKQSVDLLGGVTYQLAFDYNGGRYVDGSQTNGRILEYSLGSIVTGSMNVDDLNVYADNGPTTPWQTRSVIFTAPSSGTYELIFSTPNGLGGSGSPYVDNVRLDEVSQVPEPSVTSLLGLGIATLGLTAFSNGRRRQRG